MKFIRLGLFSFCLHCAALTLFAQDLDPSALSGLRPPEDFLATTSRQHRLATAELARYTPTLNVILGSTPETDRGCSAGAGRFLWTEHDINLAVKNQVYNGKSCESCWAFASIGATEGAYIFKYGRIVHLSEQHMLNCSGAGNCAGGWFEPALNWLKKSGTVSEADERYVAVQSGCLRKATIYKLVTWDWVDKNRKVPSKDSIKAALCAHGPLAAGVAATRAFAIYADKLHAFKEVSHGVNHGIVIEGWDDNKDGGAWYIRNSWGADWGTQGHMWIAYDSNDVGFASAWVLPAPIRRAASDLRVASKKRALMDNATKK